jgi:hypothetical protein
VTFTYKTPQKATNGPKNAASHTERSKLKNLIWQSQVLVPLEKEQCLAMVQSKFERA